MDIVERLRIRIHTSEDETALTNEAADEIERLRDAIKVQANAVRSLHYSETTEINRLRKTEREAHIAIETLDSERKANAILTAEIERLRKALNKMQRSRDRYRQAWEAEKTRLTTLQKERGDESY